MCINYKHSKRHNISIATFSFHNTTIYLFIYFRCKRTQPSLFLLSPFSLPPSLAIFGLVVVFPIAFSQPCVFSSNYLAVSSSLSILVLWLFSRLYTISFPTSFSSCSTSSRYLSFLGLIPQSFGSTYI